MLPPLDTPALGWLRVCTPAEAAETTFEKASEHMQKYSQVQDREKQYNLEHWAPLKGKQTTRGCSLPLVLQDQRRHTVLRISPEEQQEVCSRHIHRKGLRKLHTGKTEGISLPKPVSKGWQR